MNDLLTAIRASLVADGTLTALVPAADITTTYNKESANYPCLVFNMKDGGSVKNSPDLKLATVTFSAYSRTTKLATQQIIARVNTLFNNVPSNISDASTYVHVSTLADLSEGYNRPDEAWVVTATYEMMYSASTFVAFSVVSGAIYADASDVTAEAGKKIADFAGAVGLQTIFEVVYRTEQNRFRNDAVYKSGMTKIRLQRVVFKPSSVYQLWSITRNAADTLANGSTAATSYSITQASKPNHLQFLFHGVRSDNGKIIELRANKAACESMNIPFATGEISMYDVEWTCLADGSDNVVIISEEN